MGDDSGSGSNLQTLASVLAGGLAGYVDAQNQQPVTVTSPLPQTAYGYAGYGQATPAPNTGATGTIAGIPTMYVLIGVALVGFLLLRK